MKIDRKLRHASPTTIFSLLPSVIAAFTTAHLPPPPTSKTITPTSPPLSAPPSLARRHHRPNPPPVRNRRLPRHRNPAPLPNRSRKRLPLHRALIANRNRLPSNPPAECIASVINKNPRRPVVRRVKRNLHLNSSCGPQELHSLVRHQLHATREHRLPRRKIQNRRRQSVRLEIRISLNQSRNARRLLSKNHSLRGNRVAPDIHHSAAAPL